MHCIAALLRILEAMDLAVPATASDEATAAVAATAAAAVHAEIMRCGDADRSLRLAFRMLMAYLEVSLFQANIPLTSSLWTTDLHLYISYIPNVVCIYTQYRKGSILHSPALAHFCPE